MLKVGITGGIGAGKTIIKRLFQIEGIPVYDADAAAKWLMNNDDDVKLKLKNRFAGNIYDQNDQLKRAVLAKIVFNDMEQLLYLNEIVHPAVKLHSEQWFNNISQNKAFAIKEAALLFETGTYKDLDKIILVIAPLEIRIQRIMKRDGSSREQILSRIEKQLKDEDKIPLADFIINNDGNTSLIKEVQKIFSGLTGIK